jgi:putative tryptophan/tyrosine transport system substrate-binding protein
VSGIRRREFIILLLGGGAAAARPLAAPAQQQGPIIGFLHTAWEDAFRSQLAAFHHGLKNAGYIEGRNVAIEYRWAKGRLERLSELAADLVRRQVAVIASTGGNNSALAAKAATTTIPIVFTSGSDPVKLGLVASLNRPDGNLTGASFFLAHLGEKVLGLLHELVPKDALIVVLINPKSPEAQFQLADIERAAASLGRQIQFLNASTAAEIDQAFTVLTNRRAGALFISAEPFFLGQMDQLAALAMRHRIPATFVLRDFPAAGGLMSYGTSINDAYRQAGVYTGLILKGAKPADLPVTQSTRFELVINLKTAEALGVRIPPGILAIADEVIE